MDVALPFSVLPEVSLLRKIRELKLICLLFAQKFMSIILHQRKPKYLTYQINVPLKSR
jgi:hypothetical protein